MIKTKLANAIIKSLDKMRHEDDKLPIGMRGELEVIVKDRQGNILSYERGHNQVTDLAKMQIIHLLAGELYTYDSEIYSLANSGNYKLFTSTVTAANQVKQTVSSDSASPTNTHSTSQNTDGTLVSGQQYFFNGGLMLPPESTETQTIFLNQPNDISLKMTHPTKMLFGTGMEAHTSESIESVYTDKDGASPGAKLINKINGFQANNSLDASFMTALGTSSSEYNFLTNYYSGNQYRARTLQPSTITPLTSTVSSADSAIDGAIKNCYITSVTGDNSKYDSASRMAVGAYRGFGYPAFIYAQRKTDSFYDTDQDEYVHYDMNTDISSKYETELVYVVNMPTQPVNVEDISSFYPYNGWILKQAGLFCDSRYLLRSNGDGASYFNSINSSNITSGNNLYYANSAAGTLLFKRNLSSPIVKTPDVSITFAWHVYIVTN